MNADADALMTPPTPPPHRLTSEATASNATGSGSSTTSAMPHNEDLNTQLYRTPQQRRGRDGTIVDENGTGIRTNLFAGGTPGGHRSHAALRILHNPPVQNCELVPHLSVLYVF